MHTNFKFTTQPRRTQREIREIRVASWVAVAVGLGTYVVLGAGWPILIAGVLTYMVIRLKMQRRQ